jgi:hypothetical protein
MSKQQWEIAYEDWERLLRDAKATDLLDDPKAIWDESWRQVIMLASQIIESETDKETADKIKLKLERKLLR